MKRTSKGGSLGPVILGLFTLALFGVLTLRAVTEEARGTEPVRESMTFFLTPAPTALPEPTPAASPQPPSELLEELAAQAMPTPESAPKLATELDIELIARTIWGEAEVCNTTERAAVAWCILNRVDAWGQSIETVVTAEGQFLGYKPYGECPEEFYDLAADVVSRWEREYAGEEDVGRVLPKEYLWFRGNEEQTHNRFRNAWDGDYDVWEFYYIESPYE